MEGTGNRSFFMQIELDMKDLKNDIATYLDRYAYAYCEKASIDLTGAAQKYINQFYFDYHQRYYDRTDDFKKNSYYKYFKKTKNSYSGGVILSSENMKPYNRGAHRSALSAEVVFQNAIEGVHGLMSSSKHKGFAKIMNPSPIELIKIYYENQTIGNNVQYSNYAQAYAAMIKYNTFGLLSFM